MYGRSNWTHDVVLCTAKDIQKSALAEFSIYQCIVLTEPKLQFITPTIYQNNYMLGKKKSVSHTLSKKPRGASFVFSQKISHANEGFLILCVLVYFSQFLAASWPIFHFILKKRKIAPARRPLWQMFLHMCASMWDTFSPLLRGYPIESISRNPNSTHIILTYLCMYSVL